MVGAGVVLTLSKVARHCIETVRQRKSLQMFTSWANRTEAGSQLLLQHAEFVKGVHSEFAQQMLHELRGASQPEDLARLIHATDVLTGMIERNVKLLDAPSEDAGQQAFPPEAEYKELASREIPQLPSGDDDLKPE